MAKMKRIKDLKKCDVFKFNNTLYKVRQKYSQWKQNDDPYLRTFCDQLFYNEELEVEVIK